LEKVESGYLSSWINEDTDPKNWGATFVPAPQYQVLTYNGRGLKTTQQIVDSSNVVTTLTQYGYDNYDRLQCQTIRMTPASYLANACESAVSDYGPDRVTRYTYNSREQVMTEERAVGTALVQFYATYTYENGQRKSVTDANGNYTSYAYDGFNRLTHWYFPSKTTTGSASTTDYEEYGYDPNGTRTSLRKRDARTITYVPDSLGQIIEKRTPQYNVFYDYNLTGLELHARFSSGSGVGVTRVYDGFGRLKTETNSSSGATYAIGSEYDLHNNRTKVLHPDSSVYLLIITTRLIG
jgi:YD repeat-containing protein